jgi:hypothetical protein
MSDPILIASAIAEKICARLERALDILESVDESVIEHDLTEVASAVYEAQNAIRRLAHAHQAMSNQAPFFRWG